MWSSLMPYSKAKALINLIYCRTCARLTLARPATFARTSRLKRLRGTCVARRRALSAIVVTVVRTSVRTSRRIIFARRSATTPTVKRTSWTAHKPLTLLRTLGMRARTPRVALRSTTGSAIGAAVARSVTTMEWIA